MAVTFTPGVTDVVGTASQLSGALSAPVTATQVTSVTATQVTGTVTASQGGTGRTAVSNAFVAVGNGTTTLSEMPFTSRLIAYSSGVALSATGDQALTMNTSSGTSYIVRRVTIANPAAALATILAVCTIRTATNGAGSAITGTVVVTGITTTNTFLDQAVTLASATVTSTALYVNVTTAIGTGQTLPVQVYGDVVIS